MIKQNLAKEDIRLFLTNTKIGRTVENLSQTYTLKATTSDFRLFLHQENRKI